MIANPNAELFDLFPTALYATNYKEDTTAIVDYLNNQPMRDRKKTQGADGFGELSENTYLLDDPICKPLADWMLQCFNDYATNIMRWDYQEMALTQSWLTVKLPGQSHMRHTHPNTLLGGVFYFDVQPEQPSICFFKEVGQTNRVRIEPKQLDDFNSHKYAMEEQYFIPKQNDFIIFPSYLSHGVPPNKTDRPRRALGVNAITKGVLGDRGSIAEIQYSRYV